ncbi:Tat pathway signal protein [Nisaea sediminum]|uniref:Tat pathway signal protein n=1 Tax=Nisaea sediminum TaxID=2775867 RepID=UPI0018668470|nr:Tat pathway signal protein [Nisaea sediminum]
MRFERFFWTILTVLASAVLSVSVSAADLSGKRLLVELNKMEPAGEDCRTTWVLNNGTGADLARLKLDIVAFDSDGIVARRVGAELGPIGTGHTRVKLFDLKSIECGNVRRMLMNGVLACEVEGAEAASLEQCASSIETAARTTVPFTQ